MCSRWTVLTLLLAAAEDNHSESLLPMQTMFLDHAEDRSIMLLSATWIRSFQKNTGGKIQKVCAWLAIRLGNESVPNIRKHSKLRSSTLKPLILEVLPEEKNK
jgi:hypothetical protein